MATNVSGWRDSSTFPSLSGDRGRILCHGFQRRVPLWPHASDDELGHIAAGPMEHLLGKHGDKYIEKVEQRAEADPRFARMLAGVWKYVMSDHVWARVEALKAKYPATPK